MCCEAAEKLDLPPEAVEMLAHYRRLQRERGWDWGDERLPAMFRWSRFSLLGPVVERAGPEGDLAGAVRAVVGTDVPAGIVVARVDGRGRLRVDTGPARPVVAGHTTPIDVVVDSSAGEELTVTVDGREVRVEPRGAAIETLDVGGAFAITCGDAAAIVDGAVREVPWAELRLTSPRCSRWSVTDETGGAWFPDGVPHKWDYHHRPFFHAHDVTLVVPAVPLTVACARGLEFDRTEQTVTPTAHEVSTVDGDPPRLFDPAADGWYGGDLHVHLNYSGDLVCTPQDAARMQLGEGLHLANLVAGNFGSTRVYDRELLEGTVGTDLWTNRDADAVARMGLEYRNDLLGHVHALGPGAAPSRYHTGHEGSDHPDDWPPNAAACAELRSSGATVGYAHPAGAPFPDDWSTDAFFGYPRSVEARELVADAALGLVDSVDVISPFDHEGAMFLYHRLLSCGLRLAATAGTDVFLSFAHGPEVASNPPGWGRVYAQLDGAPLSVEAFKEAIRRGRTVVTNGPWLTLDVDGRGPGAVLDRAAGDRLAVKATVRGADELTIVGPDGVLAEGSGTISTEIAVDRPLWIAAIARAPRDTRTLDSTVLAHTSPVYVDVDTQRVARAADARWCLAFLDTFQAFAERHGTFSADAQRADLAEVVDGARAYYRTVLERAVGIQPDSAE